MTASERVGPARPRHGDDHPQVALLFQCCLLKDLSIFGKLWEVDVMQSNNLLCNDLARLKTRVQLFEASWIVK